MHTDTPQPNFRAGLLLVVLALLASIMLATGPADAQVATPEFARITFARSCPNELETLQPAELIEIDGVDRLRLALCGPAGFYPVRSEALCAVGRWISEASLCVTGYFASSASSPVDPAMCPSPLLFIDRFERPFGGTVTSVCAVPLLSNAGPAPRSVPPVAPVCIEDELVQDDDAAAELRVGDSFVSSSDGVTYLIVTGGPTCTFACHDGFDLNCDDKLGDYCPVEIDFRSVRGAAACLDTQPT